MLGTCGPAQKTSNGGPARTKCATSTVKAQATDPGSVPRPRLRPGDRPRPEKASLHHCVTGAGTQLRPDPLR